ncbi:hypothetical protein G7054_g2736 [Neopestalotiopsis clavispora]|nr:hypothetical protein G7054_g2736 [Neopestalotiopsis clavispora]
MKIERLCVVATKEVVLLREDEWPAHAPPTPPPPTPPPAPLPLVPRPIPHIPVERWDERSKRVWQKIKKASRQVRWWLPSAKKELAAGSSESEEEVSFFQPSPPTRCPPTPTRARPSGPIKRPREGSDDASSEPSKKNGKGKRVALAAKVSN